MTAPRLRLQWDMTFNQINGWLKKVVTFDKLSRDEIVSILAKIKTDKENNCWLYREDWSVYVSYKGRTLHRLMYETFVGPIVGKNFICHTCDRPGCINPEHLFQGTAQDNTLDSIHKGRRVQSIIGRTKRINPLRLDELRKQDNIRRLRRHVGEPDSDWNLFKRFIKN